MADVLAGKLATYLFPDRPFTLGTNGFGEVVAIGRGVYGLQPGDGVVLSPHHAAYETGSDPAPVMEVELARKAGLGWRGKHTLLLNRDQGSTFFIGTLYTSLQFPDSATRTRVG